MVQQFVLLDFTDRQYNRPDCVYDSLYDGALFALAQDLSSLFTVPDIVPKVGRGIVDLRKAYACNATSPLVALPRELVNCIVNNLDDPRDVLCLALTCGYLNDILETNVTDILVHDRAPRAGSKVLYLGDYADNLPEGLLEPAEVRFSAARQSAEENADEGSLDDGQAVAEFFHFDRHDEGETGEVYRCWNVIGILDAFRTSDTARRRAETALRRSYDEDKDKYAWPTRAIWARKMVPHSRNHYGIINALKEGDITKAEAAVLEHYLNFDRRGTNLVLRNLSTKEYVCGSALEEALLEKLVPYSKSSQQVCLGIIIFPNIGWTHSGGYYKAYTQGKWAGHRFDISSADKHEIDRSSEMAWTDVTEREVMHLLSSDDLKLLCAVEESN